MSKLLGLAASLALLGTASHAIAASVSPTDFFSEASTLGALGSNTDTGQSGNAIAQSTNPVTNVYQNSTEGYNSTSGTFVSAGGATALADRETGQLHAAAGTTSFVPGALISGASATARFGDTLFFSTPGASATTLTTVGFTMHIDGILGLPPGGSGTGSGQPGGTLSLYVGLAPTIGQFKPTTFGVHNNYENSLTWYGLPTSINQDITGSFTFEGAAASVAIFMELDAHGQYGYADFGDTASFAFDTLPTGVSFTSASGDFLAPNATPLPTALPLFATGLGALGLLARRRNRKDAAGLSAAS